MFKIGVWETSVKTKRKVAGTDATQWYCSAHFTCQNLIYAEYIIKYRDWYSNYVDS